MVSILLFVFVTVGCVHFCLVLIVVEKKAEEKDSWNWKLPFQKVSVDLAKCVEIYLGEVSEKVCASFH